MKRRPTKSKQSGSSAASDVYKKPVYDKANVGDKTHAGYELKFSSEWLASKVKGPKGAEYGALTGLLYTSPSPRDRTRPLMPSSA